ncbi:MAG TPA: hypothetical protein VHE13_17130, partial [Opitutus sp.]|nr:hypothetical protein [Opitutus sp.]
MSSNPLKPARFESFIESGMNASFARRPGGGPSSGRPSRLPAGGALAQLLAEAAAHHRAGRGRDAAERFARACALAPRSFDAHYRAGLLAVQQRRLADAATALAQATRLDPRSAPAAQALGVALAQLLAEAAAHHRA